MQVQELLSSLSHVGIASNPSIVMTLQSLTTNTPSTFFCHGAMLKDSKQMLCV